MAKGTPSYGRMGGKHTHEKCPRCGKYSLHKRHEICASCGFGKTKKLNN